MDTSASHVRQPKNSDNSASNQIASPAEHQLDPLTDLQNYTRRYVEQQPEMAAIICLGVGFVLGWKLKPW